MNRTVLYHILLVLAVTLAALPCVAQKRPRPPLKGRETIALTGPWTSADEPPGAAAPAGWKSAPPSTAVPVRMPGAPRDRVTWYWTRLSVPASWKDRNVRVRLVDLAAAATIYVNGSQLGSGTADATVTVDATKAIRPGSEFVLAIRVSPAGNTNRDVVYPFRNARLLIADEAHIDSVSVKAETGGWATVHVEITNTSEKTGDAQVEVKVTDPGIPGKALASGQSNLVISPGRNVSDIMVHVKRPRGAPSASYVAEITFRQGRDILDNESAPFTLPANP